MIDIIVPVYRGMAETRACLESVLAASGRVPFRLVVINDCGPEPALNEWLRLFAQQHPALVLLENEKNLGFVATVNRGMALSTESDVLLLNSDTEVVNDWLDRLQRAAYQEARIGTVTPFSNNATICSYPRFCVDNELPAGWSAARLDDACSRENAGVVVDIPTAVGFCMYIRRDCLAEVGEFDVATFGKGYGEENDFCRRAVKAGWRNVMACDVFVWHKGNVSFGDSHNDKKQHALNALRRLHPDYEAVVAEFIAHDPIRPYRARVDFRRLLADQRQRILCLTHQLGGGTEKHVQELARTLLPQATFLILRPETASSVALEWSDAGQSDLRLVFLLPTAYHDLLALLRGCGLSRIHIHHTLGFHPSCFGLLDDLSLAWDFTAHDYHSLCPQISLTDPQGRYCGEGGEADCAACLANRQAPGEVSIQRWRQSQGKWVLGAARVLCPSEDTAKRYRRYFPEANVVVAWHPDSAGFSGLLAKASPPAAITGRAVRVAILGALGRNKGADLLDETVRYAEQAGLPLQFKLFGYAYRPLVRAANFAVTGPYQDSQLAELLGEWHPDLVWFPAQCPETYSYTLSFCLALGLPVVATDLGAIPERIAGRAGSWVMPWATAPAAWCAAFMAPPANAAERRDAPGFSYVADYLQASTLTSVAAPETIRLYWEQHLQVRPINTPLLSSGPGRWLLKGLFRISAFPVARRLVQRMPLSLKVRLKKIILG